MLLISRQGKIRLSKFYDPIPAKERAKMLREISTLVLNRPAKQCNFIEYKDSKLVYKRCVRACVAALLHSHRAARGAQPGGRAPSCRSRHAAPSPARATLTPSPPPHPRLAQLRVALLCGGHQPRRQ